MSLWGAARRGEADSALRFLIGGQDPSEPSPERGDPPLVLAARAGHAEVVAMLLAAGADPDGRDAAGRSALHHAAARGDARMAGLLVSRGLAAVGCRDSYGELPIHAAAEGGHLGLLRLLMHHSRRCLLGYTRSPRFVARCQELFDAALLARLDKWQRQVYRLGWFHADFLSLLGGLFDDYDRQLAENARWVELREGLSARYGSHVPPPVWPPRRPGRRLRKRTRLLRRGLFGAKGRTRHQGGEGNRRDGEEDSGDDAERAADGSGRSGARSLKAARGRVGVRGDLLNVARGLEPDDHDSLASSGSEIDEAASRLGADDSEDALSFGSQSPRSEAGDADVRRQRRLRQLAASRARKRKREARRLGLTLDQQDEAAGPPPDDDAELTRGGSGGESSEPTDEQASESSDQSTDDSDGEPRLPPPGDPVALVRLVFGDAAVAMPHPASVLPRVLSARMTSSAVAVGILRIAGTGASEDDAVSPAVFAQLMAASLFALLSHAPSRRGRTPLHCAAAPNVGLTRPAHILTAQALVNEYGAEMTVGDIAGATPLDCVMRRVRMRAQAEWAVLAAVTDTGRHRDSSGDGTRASDAAAQSRGPASRHGLGRALQGSKGDASAGKGAQAVWDRATSSDWGLDAATRELRSLGAGAASRALKKLLETAEARQRLLRAATEAREQERDAARVKAAERSQRELLAKVAQAGAQALREAESLGLVGQPSTLRSSLPRSPAPAAGRPGDRCVAPRPCTAPMGLLAAARERLAEGAPEHDTELRLLVTPRGRGDRSAGDAQPGQGDAGSSSPGGEGLSRAPSEFASGFSSASTSRLGGSPRRQSSGQAAAGHSAAQRRKDGPSSSGEATSRLSAPASGDSAFAADSADGQARSPRHALSAYSSSSSSRDSAPLFGHSDGSRDEVTVRLAGRRRRACSSGAAELGERTGHRAVIPSAVRSPPADAMPSFEQAHVLADGGDDALALRANLEASGVAPELLDALERAALAWPPSARQSVSDQGGPLSARAVGEPEAAETGATSAGSEPTDQQASRGRAARVSAPPRPSLSLSLLPAVAKLPASGVTARSAPGAKSARSVGTVRFADEARAGSAAAPRTARRASTDVTEGGASAMFAQITSLAPLPSAAQVSAQAIAEVAAGARLDPIVVVSSSSAAAGHASGSSLQALGPDANSSSDLATMSQGVPATGPSSLGPEEAVMTGPAAHLLRDLLLGGDEPADDESASASERAEANRGTPSSAFAGGSPARSSDLLTGRSRNSHPRSGRSMEVGAPGESPRHEAATPPSARCEGKDAQLSARSASSQGGGTGLVAMEPSMPDSMLDGASSFASGSDGGASPLHSLESVAQSDGAPGNGEPLLMQGSGSFAQPTAAAPIASSPRLRPADAPRPSAGLSPVPRIGPPKRAQTADELIARLEERGARFHFDVPLLALLKTAASRQAAGIRVSDWADGKWLGERERLVWDRLHSPLRLVELEGVPMTVAEWQRFGARLLESKRFLVQRAAARIREVRTEENRIAAMLEQDPERLVLSDVPGSGALIPVKHRRAERAEFLRSLGIRRFSVAGRHVLRVPPTVREVMLQVWGGGGGGGRSRDGVGGDGGGGAYVETIVQVRGGDELVIVVGEGGKGGQLGYPEDDAERALKDALRRIEASTRAADASGEDPVRATKVAAVSEGLDPESSVRLLELMAQHAHRLTDAMAMELASLLERERQRFRVRSVAGGAPGGGEGRSGNRTFASGSGGGFSAVYLRRRTLRERKQWKRAYPGAWEEAAAERLGAPPAPEAEDAANGQLLALAGGGGGGGTRPGRPGGAAYASVGGWRGPVVRAGAGEEAHVVDSEAAVWSLVEAADPSLLGEGSEAGHAGAATTPRASQVPSAPAGASHGFYGSDGRWVPYDPEAAEAAMGASAPGPSGEYDETGAWVPAADAGAWGKGATPGAASAGVGSEDGFYDADGTWTRWTDIGEFDADGNWVLHDGSGWYDPAGDYWPAPGQDADSWWDDARSADGPEAGDGAYGEGGGVSAAGGGASAPEEAKEEGT
ncbi:hypothetical protein FNF31_07186 [Cafeteria roenbergensis]|uniref:Glycine-rich domain-containing protein n=2 Tax=Cafeteria roenbergensis TaxID=33653 RepID=A0A5A8CA96_CAFRO|nr:hypothetical protein FNF31_07186 [Cafeteria roenbergensis]